MNQLRAEADRSAPDQVWLEKVRWQAEFVPGSTAAGMLLEESSGGMLDELTVLIDELLKEKETWPQLLATLEPLARKLPPAARDGAELGCWEDPQALQDLQPDIRRLLMQRLNQAKGGA